jgi:ParB family chromosome partitioning protein
VAKNQRGLGRGLDALLPSATDAEEGIIEIDIDQVVPRKDQPRRKFSEESLQELTMSIMEHGVLQPVLVRPQGDKYEIVAGERRWRAASRAELEKIPAIVKEMNDLQAAEVALIENIQRDDLTIIEEATGYKNLIERFGYTQESLANRVGKSRSHITNCLRILTLPEKVVEMVEEGVISGGHARALLSLGGERDIIRAAEEVAAGKLSVRQTEQRVRNKTEKVVVKKNSEIKEMEQRLEEKYGTRAEIVKKGNGGKIELMFYSRDDLERILEIMELSS